METDVLAWVHTWLTPAKALMPRGGPAAAHRPGRGGSRSHGAVLDYIPDGFGLRGSRAQKVRFVDLDQLDRPETARKMGPLFAASGVPVRDRRVVERLDQQVRARARKIDARRGETIRSG